MIQLTRLNGKKFVLNCELIKYLEETPDTVITLTDKEKFMVRESVSEIIEATIQFRRTLFENLFSIEHMKNSTEVK